MDRPVVLKRRRELLLCASAFLLAVLTLFSLRCGQWELPWSAVFSALTGGECDTGILLTVRDLRLPRTLLAILSGAALGVAGAILQKVLRNDLASPDLLGISAGGGAAGLALLLLFPGAVSCLGIAVFSGALISTMLIYRAAWKRGVAPERLLLAGISFGAVFGSFSGLLLLLYSDRLTGIFDFTLGGFSGKSWQELELFAPLFAITFVAAALLKTRIQLLSLGDETAALLGLGVERNRLAAIVVAAAGAAGAAGVAGMLGFAGLIAPHTARLLGGGSGDNGFFLTESALIGGTLVLAGDAAGRMAGGCREIPAGLFLTAAGALFFLFLLLKERKRS